MLVGEVLAAVLPLVGGWLASAMNATFWALRLGVYAVLVGAAWIHIIEEEGLEYRLLKKRRHRQCVSSGGGGFAASASSKSPRLSEAGLRSHNARYAQARHPPPPSMACSEVTSESSIEDCSILEADSELGNAACEEDSQQAASGVPAASQASAAPAHTLQPVAASPAAAPALTPATPATAVKPAGNRSRAAASMPACVQATPQPHPPVSVAAVPTPPSHESSVADEVLPDAVAELAEDRDEKEALAVASLTTGMPVAGDAGTGRGSSRHRHKHKKPWLNRKLEGLIKPYTGKTHAAGIMVYKGLGKMGARMERGAGTLGKHLDGAIRDAGGEAAVEIEGLIKKWVKFAGIVAFLTVALMPLPNVHVTLSTG